MEQACILWMQTVDDLKKWNNIRGNKVASGKNLKINGVEADQKSTAVAKVEIDKKGIQKDSLATPTNSIYVVQKGDNLSNIAKKFNVTVAELQDWNKLTTKSISLGASLQVVKNPIHNEVIAEPVERKDIAYSVQKGDNLGSIAKKFGASVEELKQPSCLEAISKNEFGHCRQELHLVCTTDLEFAIEPLEYQSIQKFV